MDESEKPPASPLNAFKSGAEEELDSRVTLLLLLGAMYGRGRESVRQDLEKIIGEFPLPPFQPDVRPDRRMDTSSHVSRFEEAYKLDPFELSGIFESDVSDTTRSRREKLAELVVSLYEYPRATTIADILFLSIGDPNELVRVASAISFLDLFNDVSEALRVLLYVLIQHEDEMAGHLSETALRRFGLAALGAQPPSQPPGVGSGPPSNSAIVVHGSHFAFVGSKIGTWWQPGGNFHTFIAKKFGLSLYDKQDFYTWSGGWSDHARMLAARDLKNWSQNRNLSKFDVLAHSHGGNVVMWATQLGVELNNLILLSCPVHKAYYQPEFTRLKKVISYQIRLDWVILADGGGTYFNDTRIDDRVLRKWFRHHTDTHDPGFWKSYGLSI